MLRFAIAAYLIWLFVVAATAQHNHPPQDAQLHEQFYSTWKIPDSGRPRVSSCCSLMDCYPTQIRLTRAGNYEARRREDGAWINIPPGILEQNQSDPRESPDGSSHVCMQPPGQYNRVYCAVLGSAG